MSNGSSVYSITSARLYDFPQKYAFTIKQKRSGSSNHKQLLNYDLLDDIFV